MALYQVQTSVNSQKVNTDVECSSLDNAMNFIKSLSVGEILSVKKYLFILEKKNYDKDEKIYRYAKVTIIFRDTSNTVIKIPKLKDSVTQNDLVTYFNNIYRNVHKINISLTSK